MSEVAVLPRPSVLLHIGEPKTGTSFLQDTMWSHRAELAEQGVHLPGAGPDDHFRAAMDLLERRIDPRDPRPRWTGMWDTTAARVRAAGGLSVVSHELLTDATKEQAERAVRSFGDREVHLMITLRAITGLLPAEWSESVKHRTTRSWPDWLHDVVDDEYPHPDRRQFWFWRMHDTAEVLRIWASTLPPERVHLVTVPPRGAPGETLWLRVAALLGVDLPVRTGARPTNASLGVAELEFVRQLNEALAARAPDLAEWYHLREVKDRLVGGSLGRDPATPRLSVPASRLPWCRVYADGLVEELAARGHPVIGDLAELRSEPAPRNTIEPADVTAEQKLDVAVLALASYLADRYADETATPRPPTRGAGLAERALDAVEHSPRLRRLAVRARLPYRWAAAARSLVLRLTERGGRT